FSPNRQTHPRPAGPARQAARLPGDTPVTWWETIAYYWKEITTWTVVINSVLILITIPWALAIKKEAISAIAWCLLVLLLPVFGAVLFVLFGYQSVHRPLIRKRRHRRVFRVTNPAGRQPMHAEADQPEDLDPTWERIGR